MQCAQLLTLPLVTLSLLLVTLSLLLVTHSLLYSLFLVTLSLFQPHQAQLLNEGSVGPSWSGEQEDEKRA
jgi:hypothetical protein